MLQSRVVISLAAIKALDATPVQLLPAAPTGYAYDVFDVVVSANNAAVPFAAGGPQYVGFTAAPATYKLGAVDLSALAGGNKWVTNMSGAGALAQSEAQANALAQPVYFGGGSADLTGGDAPVAITVFYTLVALP